MNDESLKPSPDDPSVHIKQGATIEEMKQSIRIIEGMFHAVNASAFPLQWHEAMMKGMTFLRAIHSALLKEIGPEEIEKIKKSEAFKAGQVPAGAA